MANESKTKKRIARKGFTAGSIKLPMVEPEAVGMSSERLGRIRVAMQRYVDKKLVPGVVSLGVCPSNG